MFIDISAGSNVINCIFDSNLSPTGGGGIFINASAPTITNCTFWNNIGGPGNGDGIRAVNSPAVVTNCIMWDGPVSEIGTVGPPFPGFAFCNVQGSGGSAAWNAAFGTDNGNNIDVDPLFMNAPGIDTLPGTPDDDLRLTVPGSPCVDTGTGIGAPATDINGVLRPQGIGHDMGAYEQ